MIYPCKTTGFYDDRWYTSHRPLLCFSQKDIIGLGFQGVDILSDGLQSTAWELGENHPGVLFSGYHQWMEIVRSWYQSCIHPDMSSHIWCIVLCSSYLCRKTGNQGKLVFEVKVCQTNKHRANKEEPSNWSKLSDPDTTDGCQILHQLMV